MKTEELKQSIRSATLTVQYEVGLVQLEVLLQMINYLQVWMFKTCLEKSHLDSFLSIYSCY